MEDSRSLALRTADRADLHKEHEWFMGAADLCEITRFRNMDGPFGSEFSVKKLCPRFVRGCPRLRGPKFCMSAVVRGVACSLLVVRGCPRREKGLKKEQKRLDSCPRLSAAITDFKNS